MFSGKIMPVSISASKLVLQEGLDGSKCHPGLISHSGGLGSYQVE